MDPLVSKLNQQIAEKIKDKTANVPQQGPSTFDEVLSSKRADASFSVLNELVSDSRIDSVKAQSAENIQISFANSETGTTSNYDPKKNFFNIFESLNSDMLSLDSSIEVLANPDVKLSKRQLLAYQAGISNMTINSELFSKLAQSVSQNLNTLLQTNIG